MQMQKALAYRPSAAPSQGRNLRYKKKEKEMIFRIKFATNTAIIIKSHIFHLQCIHSHVTNSTYKSSF